MSEALLSALKRVIPKKIFAALQPAYHFALAFCAALWYWFPSRHIRVVAVTGTKGKSTVVELTAAVLDEAGYRVASLSTIQFRIGDEVHRNLYKMTTPGRFFVQKFLRRAARAGCAYAVVEMTSEAARQFRHAFINFDALIFTNLSPEHIESHGSYEKYRDAKLSLVRALEHSPKRPRIIVANLGDAEGQRFLDARVEERIPYRFSAENTKPFISKLHGAFNQENMLAAAAFARSQGVAEATIARALANTSIIPGRVEYIQCGQDFGVVVDYAHTPDSLKKLYQAFPDKRKICVLGNTGGGRDAWKRSEMGRIADEYCDKIILTNEDPYDEDPATIIEAMARGVKRHTPEIIMDRREAIRAALRAARAGDTVLITGKGTDPYIMGPRGAKVPWDDREVAREELYRLLKE